jgi:hypothetical protein
MKRFLAEKEAPMHTLTDATVHHVTVPALDAWLVWSGGDHRSASLTDRRPGTHPRAHALRSASMWALRGDRRSRRAL